VELAVARGGGHLACFGEVPPELPLAINVLLLTAERIVKYITDLQLLGLS
jgi:hypothetical protein